MTARSRASRTFARRAVAVAVLVATGPAAAALATAAPSAAVASATAPARSTGRSAPPTRCPVHASCVTIPATCPKTTTCPEVIARPTTGLGPNQSVFLALEHFNPDHDVSLNYCTDTGPLSKRPPDCVYLTIPALPAPQVVLHPLPDGTATYSYQVLLWPDNGNPALTGGIPGTATRASFFCDQTTHPCSIDVTDPSLDPSHSLTPLPDNTAVIPLRFQKAGSGCRRAQLVHSVSEWGLDSLFPIAAEVSCAGKLPAADINTDQNGLTAVSALAAGSTQIAFTDAPNAADERAALAGMRGHVAYIPIAVSANVIGFSATMLGQQSYPDARFALTPTMAAGILTGFYTYPGASDVVKHCPRGFGNPCSLLYALNAQSRFATPQRYGAYVRSDTTSSTGELFAWMCDAPNVPVRIGSHSITDTNRPFKVLQAAWQENNLTLRSCPGNLDQMPSFTAPPYFAAVGQPFQQVQKLQGLVPPPNLSTFPVAGFAPMNWAEAQYFGLDTAALQNAAGRFVVPTARSLDAAVADAVAAPDGTLTPSFTKRDPNAYPLPEIFYAVVSTKPLPAAEARVERSALLGLLSVTGGGRVRDLPDGFVPLPSSMYKQAVAAVAAEITSQGANVPPATTTTTTTAPRSRGTAGPRGQTTGDTNGHGRHRPMPVPRPTGGHREVTRLLGPSAELFSFQLIARRSGWLVLELVIAAAAALIFGPGLIWRARRIGPKGAARGDS